MIAHLLSVKSFTAGLSLPLCHSFYFSLPPPLPLWTGSLTSLFVSARAHRDNDLLAAFSTSLGRGVQTLKSYSVVYLRVGPFTGSPNLSKALELFVFSKYWSVFTRRLSKCKLWGQLDQWLYLLFYKSC